MAISTKTTAAEAPDLDKVEGPGVERPEQGADLTPQGAAVLALLKRSIEPEPEKVNYSVASLDFNHEIFVTPTQSLIGHESVLSTDDAIVTAQGTQQIAVAQDMEARVWEEFSKAVTGQIEIGAHKAQIDLSKFPTLNVDADAIVQMESFGFDIHSGADQLVQGEQVIASYVGPTATTYAMPEIVSSGIDMDRFPTLKSFSIVMGGPQAE